jgi:HEAT repeat protein
MIQALKDPEHGVRGTASRNLAKLSPQAVPAQLMDLMDDSDADCRRAAHWALRHFGKVGVAVLVDRLDHKDPKARIAALESLNSLPNPEADFAVVEKALDDDDPEVRLVAVEKVWMSSNGYASRALAALTKVAEDEALRVREAASLRRRQIEERMRLGRVSTVGHAMWKHCEAHGRFARRGRQAAVELASGVVALPRRTGVV